MVEETAQKLPTMMVPPISTTLAPDDWKVVKDVGPAPNGAFPIQFDKLLCDGETHIGGEVGLERAEGMGSLVGENHAKRILDRQELIPVECRPFVLLILGTVRLSPSGSRFVLCLFWSVDRWYSRWYWLRSDFSSDYRVVRLCK